MFTEKFTEDGFVITISGDVIRGSRQNGGKTVVEVDSSFCRRPIVRPRMGYRSEGLAMEGSLSMDTLFEGFRVFMASEEVSTSLMAKIKEVVGRELPKMQTWMEKHTSVCTTIVYVQVWANKGIGSEVAEVKVYLRR